MFAESWWKVKEPVRDERLYKRDLKAFVRWGLVRRRVLGLGCDSLRLGGCASNVVARAIVGFSRLGSL